MFREHQKRIQRGYATIVVAVTTVAGAYAIEQRGASDQAVRDRAATTRLQGEARRIAAHAGDTEAHLAELRRTYRGVVRRARRHERTMLRDLAAARRAARSTGAPAAAPVSYATSVDTSYASAAPVASAAASEPTTSSS